MQDEAFLLRGLRELAHRWEHVGHQLMSPRLEGAMGREFRMECQGESVLYLRLAPGKATVVSVPSGYHPHATISMRMADWQQVLSGRWSVMTVVLGGRTNFPKHERRYIMQLSMLMQALFLMEL
jgi:hypothetical protein